MISCVHIHVCAFHPNFFFLLHVYLLNNSTRRYTLHMHWKRHSDSSRVQRLNSSHNFIFYHTIDFFFTSSNLVVMINTKSNNFKSTLLLLDHYFCCSSSEERFSLLFLFGFFFLFFYFLHSLRNHLELIVYGKK